jgi:hypothetical protein
MRVAWNRLPDEPGAASIRLTLPGGQRLRLQVTEDPASLTPLH